jgi:high-affinity iron transporter
MLGNFLIGLREGIEAALIVSILLGYLVRTERRELAPLVWRGVWSAIAMSIAVAVSLQLISTELSDRLEPAFSGAISFVAVGFVTWMIFWMKRASRTIASDLRTKFDHAAVSGSQIAITGMAFAAVAREGAETAVFFWAAAKATGHVAVSLLGLVLGLGFAIAIGYALYRSSRRIDLARLFKVTSILLVFVAAGVLSYGIAEWQEIGVLPGSSQVVLDLSSVLVDGSLAEVLVGGLFNIHALTTSLQAASYLGFIATVLPLLLRPATAPVASSPNAAR